jgi:predicted lipid-binding transport protein (Tim44 family)
MFRTFFRGLAMLAIVIATVGLLATTVDARVGGGMSSGSRGSRTYSAPPSTSTAPSGAPMQRSVTQPGLANSAPRPFGGGFFNRSGMLGGFLSGFLAAGLLGMLFGHGFGFGLGGFFSFIGLVLQLGLIAFIGMMLWRYFQRRNMPAYASNPSSNPYRGATPQQRSYFSGAPLGGSGGSAQRSDDVGITGADYDAFERLLGDIQTAYSAEDIAALRSHTTPEMLSYLSEDLAKNASRGIVNRISDVKLLQGDLAEAWREGDSEYATVAMRFSLIDCAVERSSGRVVDGDANRPQEATELWTFRRVRGGSWIVSAIQQTA